MQAVKRRKPKPLSTALQATAEPNTVPVIIENHRQAGTSTQARVIQRILVTRMLDPKCTNPSLAALAKAWCGVSEVLRVWTGRPSPGQLRPDLDPVQMARAMKRLKARLPTDISARIAEPTEEPTTNQTVTEPEPETPKESLLPTGTAPTEPPPEEDE